MPLILGTNSIKDTGYNVANSLRFNNDSSDYLTRTPDTAGNQKTFTFSAWVKRSGLNDRQAIISTVVDGSNETQIWFDTNDELFLYHNTSGTNNIALRTTAKFRDISAWYHIVFAVDTTQSTASNRVKLYVNSVQQTSFTEDTYPDQNFDTRWNNGSTPVGIGRMSYNAEYFDGYMAEMVLLDGSALGPTSFGEFDEDSPTIWKPKDVSGLTFGTNGFYLEFKQSGTSQNSSGLGADTSGQDNHFAVNNLTAVDQSTDTCTNNFATLNVLHFNATIPSAGTLSDGNLTFTSAQGSSAYPGFYSTIAVSQGKWYAEFKATTADGSTLGIGDGVPIGGFLGGSTNDGVIFHNGNFYTNGSGASTGYDAWSDDDILGVALDLDNNKVYFHKNNTYMASGNPAGNSGGEAITAAASTNSGVYHFCAGDASSGTPAIQCNFGSPPFAISSGNTDGNGFGNFEYTVPSGYFALCTKNLAENG